MSSSKLSAGQWVAIFPKKSDDPLGHLVGFLLHSTASLWVRTLIKAAEQSSSLKWKYEKLRKDCLHWPLLLLQFCLYMQSPLIMRAPWTQHVRKYKLSCARRLASSLSRVFNERSQFESEWKSVASFHQLTALSSVFTRMLMLSRCNRSDLNWSHVW